MKEEKASKDHEKMREETHEAQSSEKQAHGSESVHDTKKKPHKKEEDHKEWQARIDELNDKYIRLYSEFDNYRKRTQREKADWSRNASEEIIKALLPVLDDMDRAVKASETAADAGPVKDGVVLIQSKLKAILGQRGLEAVESVGQPFDVELHDALTTIPASTEDMKGKVIEEIEKGYLLNGKVIRYARVVVAN